MPAGRKERKIMKIYYQHPNTWFGDCMPFGKDDTFYLFDGVKADGNVDKSRVLLESRLAGIWQPQRIL